MRLDLWNTGLEHLCPRAADNGGDLDASVCPCVCCLRPILRTSLHTRTFQWDDSSMHVVLQRSRTPRDCPLHREQMRILRESYEGRGEYYLCHMCAPNFKKSIRELETTHVSYPSKFIASAFHFIQVIPGSIYSVAKNWNPCYLVYFCRSLLQISDKT